MALVTAAVVAAIAARANARPLPKSQAGQEHPAVHLDSDQARRGASSSLDDRFFDALYYWQRRRVRASTLAYSASLA